MIDLALAAFCHAQFPRVLMDADGVLRFHPSPTGALVATSLEVGVEVAILLSISVLM
jgi:hypothetical protein